MNIITTNMPKSSNAKKKRSSKQTLAMKADPHRLYQVSVQSPDADIDFFAQEFVKIRKREPMILREDFCGTALLSTRWCKSHTKRTAVGVDLCASTLAWGRTHNLKAQRVEKRVQLIEADVRSAKTPKVDITCAMNFSFCVFKTRSDFLAYLRSALLGLKDDGILVLELCGGTEAEQALEFERPVEDFTYIWEQAKYNPIDHATLCHIHFAFRDGSRLDKAFTYDWRLWTIPEIRELLAEAGFRESRVYWEQVAEDEDDPDTLKGTGEYLEVSEVENQSSWLVYILGIA